MARPTKYNARVKAKALRYLEDYPRHKHAVPSVAGFAMILGVARSTLYKWAKDHQEFSNILEVINTHQEVVALNKGLKNIYNPQLVKLLLGKHGYHEKQDIESPNGTMTPVLIRRTVVDPHE